MTKLKKWRFVYLLPGTSAGGPAVRVSRYARRLVELGYSVLVVRWIDRASPFHAKDRGLFEDLDCQWIYFDGRHKSTVVAKNILQQIELRNHDIIISQQMPWSSFVVNEARREMEIVHIEIVVGDHPTQYLMAKLAFPTCDMFGVLSKRIMNNLSTMLHKSEAYENVGYVFCPAGVEPVKDPVERGQIPPLRIIYTGRFDEGQKRITDQIAVAESLKKKDIRFELTLVGGGNADPYRQMISDKGLSNEVTIANVVPPDQVADYLSNAHVFLLTSAYEGFPNSLAEAMSYGLIPVSTKVSGAEDVIVDRENGFLVDVGDVKTIVDVLRSLAGGRLNLNRLSSKASATAKQIMSIDSRVDTFVHGIESHLSALNVKRNLPRHALIPRSKMENLPIPDCALLWTRIISSSIRSHKSML